MGLVDKLNSIHGVVALPDDSLVKIVVLRCALIWLWMPKNAGGSISRQLMKSHGGAAIASDLPLPVLRRLNPEFKTFKIVAFKRNPYTRIVSCWLNKIMAPAEANEGYFRNYPGLRPRMPFCDFAAWLNSPAGGDDKANVHWMSQHLMLQRVDRLLMFESLPEPVRELGIEPRDLPHRNQHKEMAEVAGIEDRALLDWYDDRSFRHITERYAKDLEVLGYAFPGAHREAQAAGA